MAPVWGAGLARWARGDAVGPFNLCLGGGCGRAGSLGEPREEEGGPEALGAKRNGRTPQGHSRHHLRTRFQFQSGWPLRHRPLRPPPGTRDLWVPAAVRWLGRGNGPQGGRALAERA